MPGVGNWVMSPPVSAMKTSAMIWRSPGCSPAGPGPAKRLHQLVDPSDEFGDVLGVRVDPVQEHRVMNA